MNWPWSKIVAVEEIDEALVSGFSCGNDAMDDWFLSKALNWCYLGFCQVHVAVDEDGVVGFFSLSPTQIEPESLSRKLKDGKTRMGHPGLLLGGIAVRSDLQRSSRRVGALLLEHAVCEAYEVSKIIGGRFIVLDAKTDELCAWYGEHSFKSLKDSRHRMVLPVKDAAATVKALGGDHFRFCCRAWLSRLIFGAINALDKGCFTLAGIDERGLRSFRSVLSSERLADIYPLDNQPTLEQQLVYQVLPMIFVL